MAEIERFIVKEYAQVFEQTTGVRRFVAQDYPPGAVVDNTKDHITRGLQMIARLPLAQAAIVAIARPFFLHDLPEPLVDVSKDVVVTLKSTVVGEDRRRAEILAARRLFFPADLELYLEVDLAAQVLGGDGLLEGKPISYGPALAAIMDRVEGSSFFHHKASEWHVTSWKPGLPTFPPATFEYALETHKTCLFNLDRLDLPRRCYLVAQSLLNVMLLRMVQCWRGIPDERIPEVMRNVLTKARNLLDNPETALHVHRVGAAVI